MKNISLLLILLSLNTLAFAQPNKTKAADEKALRYLKEVEWPKSYREQDTVLLDKILADEFQGIDAAGEVSTKKLEMAYIQKNKPTYASFHYNITRLEVFENGTAIVSGIGTIKGTNEKGAYEMTYHSSNVFIKRKNQWKAINSHISGVKQITL